MFELIVEIFERDKPTLSWAAPQVCVATEPGARRCAATLYPTREACSAAAADLVGWAWKYSAEKKVVVSLHCREIEPEPERVS